MNVTSHPVPEEAENFSHSSSELNLSTKAMSINLGITDVWMRRLLNNDIIPSQHLLKAIVTSMSTIPILHTEPSPGPGSQIHTSLRTVQTEPSSSPSNVATRSFIFSELTASLI